METPNQKKIWGNIAPEWHKLKLIPSEAATNFLNNSKGRIIDFGSGSGRNLLELKNTKDKEIYLVDFSDEMIKLAKKRAKKLKIPIQTKVEDITKTSYENNFFDAAICTATIHCIETKEKRKKAIKELFRILKPKAKAEIEVWNKNSKMFKNKPKEKFIAWRDKGKRYYYLYDEKEIKKLLQVCSFKIIKKIPHNANIIFIIEKPQ